ncbi:ABC transporter permease [Humisphaera borealis]|uniref:ABC transporter permease n=1 Tax=Humisphaera borealis TaxID=2807512 RepID=A0A7M2X008_9BACT|nr:ABC transporter permease [Humisphaera borealis]QOV91019.1 ABC transporter permease [Humisphaera borealis]
MLFRIPFAIFTLFWQSAFLALGQIWANKVRAILTTIGIVIGVASVTAVIAALTGLKQNVLSEFESFGTNKIFINPQIPDGNRRVIRWSDLRFEPDLFDDLMAFCPSVKAITRQTSLTRSVSFGNKTESDVDVQGIDASWHDIEKRAITQGRRFDYTDNRNARAVCLINDKMREQIGLPPDPIGSSILIGERRYTIVGVVESRAESSMFRRANSSGSECFVPFSTAYRRGDHLNVIAACRSPELSEEARAEITFFLRKKRKIGIGQPDNFRVDAVEKFVQQFTSVATAITLVAGGIVGISLLVGGVGIMNIMLVSVSERTREIGLRKAVGARPGAILLQFLVEAVVLCLMGGLVGVLGGQGLTSLMASIPGSKLDRAAIPLWAIGLSFGFSALVGVVFGMFPAIKAARLDPIDALRHE